MGIIIALIVLHLLWSVRRRRGDWWTIEVAIDVMLLAVFGYGGLVVPFLRERLSSDWELLFCIVSGLLALYAGLHWGRPRAFRQHVQWSSLKGKFPTWLLWTLFSMYMGVALYQMSLNVTLRGSSFTDYFLGDRLVDYGRAQVEGIAGVWNLAAVFRVGALVLLADLIRKGKPAALVVYGGLVFAILGVFRTRLEVLITLALLPIGIHTLRRRIPKWLLALLLVGGLVAHSFLNLWRGFGFESAFSSDRPVLIDTVQLTADQDLNTLRGFLRLWDLYTGEQLPLEHGVNYAYALLAPVPRLLWPNKPATAFESRWTQKLEGSLLSSDRTSSVWTFTAWGEGLAQFGLAGVALNLLIYGLIVKRTDSYLRRDRAFILAWFYYAGVGSTFLRGGVQALAVMSFYFCAGAMLVTWAMHRRSASFTGRASPVPASPQRLFQPGRAR